jgi:Tol biopolymer transport system component
MTSSFGPWSTAMHSGAAAQLSTFWKRRMAMLFRVSANRPALTRRAGFLLVVAGVAACALPTFQVLPAGDRSAVRADERNSKPTEPAKAGRIYYHLDFHVATVQPDGQEPMELARPADADILGYNILSDRLSPDGKRIAFGKAVMKEVDGQLGAFPPDRIYVRDVAKTDAADLLVEKEGVEIHNFVWSPDGDKLAFTTWDKENARRNWIVDAKSKRIEEVKLPRFKLDDKEYTMAVEAWSPDGKHFLAGGNGLHLVKTDGTGAKRLTKEHKGLFGGHCQFSPNGRNVLFVVVHEGQSMTLHVADLAGGKERTLVEARSFTDLRGGWSPDSHRVAYSGTPLTADGKRAGETSLFVVDADGRNRTTILTEIHDPDVIRLRLIDWR